MVKKAPGLALGSELCNALEGVHRVIVWRIDTPAQAEGRVRLWLRHTVLIAERDEE